MAKRSNFNDHVNSSADFAEDIIGRALSVFQRFNTKLTTQGTTVSSDKTIGHECEVSVAIPANGTGEVIVKHGGSLRNYSARAAQKGESFKRGAKVVVVDSASDLLYVEDYAI